MKYTTISKMVVLSCLLLFVFTFFCVKNNYIQKKISRLSKCNKIHQLPMMEVGSREKRVVLIGDSRISNWKDQKFGENLIVHNLGIPGATSNEVFCAIEGKLDSENVDLSVIQLGINDLVAASFLKEEDRELVRQQLLANIKSLTQYLSSIHSDVLVLSIVPPIKVDVVRKILWGQSIDSDVEEVNKSLQNELIGDNIIWFDMKSIMYDFENDMWDHSLSSDALHWKKEVYNSLNIIVKDVVDGITQ